MGKRIIQQARGHGSHTYRVKRKAFRHRLKYPSKLEGVGKIIKLVNSPGHTAPLAKVKYDKGVFFMPACKNMYEGQEISFGKNITPGNIVTVKDIPIKTRIYCIESKPGDGGVFIKSGGNAAIIKFCVHTNAFKKRKKISSTL